MLTSNLWCILIMFLSNLPVEVVFDMNAFDPNEDLREHPDIHWAPPVWTTSPQYRTREGYILYYPHAKVIRISTPMHDTPYETLLCLGFTPEQILSAKRIATQSQDTPYGYEIKTHQRTYRAYLSHFEEWLGGPDFLHGRGADCVFLYWDFDTDE